MQPVDPHAPPLPSLSENRQTPPSEYGTLPGDAVDSLDTRTFAAADTPSSSRGKPIEGAIGQYELLGELGRGGMGVVYLARHQRLGRLAALKVIRSGELASDDEIRRFQAEAAAAAQLDHPGIVPVFEAGVDHSREGPRHYLALAFVEGQTLSDWIHDAPLEPRHAAKTILLAAEAVDYAHRRGIIHRDLKPQNILVTPEGQPRIADFGLAKRTLRSEGSLDAAMTGSGQVLGTPGYMPPEQAAGLSERVGREADIYSLGATLYCALSGRPPFQSASAYETLRQVIEQEPVSLRQLNRAVPRDLETICAKCLQKEPRQRYATCAELAEELRRFLDGKPIRARPISRPERVWRWSKRNPLVALLGTAAFVFLAATAIVSSWAYVQQTRLNADLTELAEEERVQRRRAEDELYVSQIARGAAALDARKFDTASAALDDTPPLAARGWEYHFLKRRLQGTPLTLDGFAAQVNVVAYSGDGNLLAAATNDRELDVFDLRTGKLDHSIPPPSNVAHLSFDRRRPHLFIVCRDGSVMIWDVAKRRRRLSWQAHGSPVSSAAVSPDGETLATASADGTVKLWDVKRAAEKFSFRGHGAAAVLSVAYSPDGKLIASGSGAPRGSGRELILWRAADGEIEKRLSGPTFGVSDVAFSPTEDLLVSVVGSGVWLWRPSTGEMVREIDGHKESVTAAIFSPDGKRLATCSLDGTARLWDPRTGAEVQRFDEHARDVLHAAFSPDGKRLATSAGDLALQGSTNPFSPGEVKVWNVAGRDFERALPLHRVVANSIAFEPNSTTIACGANSGEVKFVNAVTGEEAAPMVEFGSQVMSLVYHRSEPLLAISGIVRGKNGGLALFNIKTRELRPLAGHKEMAFEAAFSPDGQMLASAGDAPEVKLWSVSEGRLLATLSGHTANVGAFAFSPDGNSLVSCCGDDSHPGEFIVWDLTTRKERLRFQGHEGNKYGIVFSPDGATFASSTLEGPIHVWSAATGERLSSYRGHGMASIKLIMGGEGKRQASVSHDGTLRLWDPARGIEMLSLGPYPDRPTDVAFSSDGSILACSTFAGHVRVFDARRHADVLRLGGHDAELAAVGFSRSGQLISLDKDGRALVWALPDGGSQPTKLSKAAADKLSPTLRNYRVEIDPLDQRFLRLSRTVEGQLPFQPWEEAAARQ